MASADPSTPKPTRDPFTPEDVDWQRISPRWAAAQRLITLIVFGAVIVVVAVLAILLTPWIWTALIAVVPLGVWDYLWPGRQVKVWGYAERDDDLLVVKGIMWRSLVVVPYGRLQYVDVEAGPIDRKFGIAKVQLHTASSDTDAAIPGLPPEEAARLRDRLMARGEARLAGL